MKRVLWLLGLLTAVIFGGGLFPSSDVAELQPVEVLRIANAEGQLLVQTDTGEIGLGATLEEAFGNLKDSAPREIFLDTAEYVLLAPENRECLAELLTFLRPASKVCLEIGRAELESVAEFLDTHQPVATLMDPEKIQCLIVEEGRMWLGNP